MSTRQLTIDEHVLQAIADDYESFELIAEQVDKWMKEDNVPEPSSCEVSDALGRLIHQGHAQAYVLPPTPPHVTPVEFSQDRLHELWYYATAKRAKSP